VREHTQSSLVMLAGTRGVRAAERWTPLRAALLPGVIGALWHVIAMEQAGQSAAWIAWGCLDRVPARVLMVWIYTGAGKRVFAVALYHASANLSIKTLFPGGSYEAERLPSLILVGEAVSVVLVHRRPRGPLPFRHGGRRWEVLRGMFRP
jgi:hypothetical protein